MNRTRMAMWVLLMLTGCMAVKAQHTIYATKTTGGFLQAKQTIEISEGGLLQFEQSALQVKQPDGTTQRISYTTVDNFFLRDPGAGLYRPNYLRNVDFNNPLSLYSFERSRQSAHFVVFWEPDFGSDPTQAPAPYTFDPDDLLERAEKAFDVYTGQLGFPKPGSSPTLDTYKIIMLVHYTDTWRATGSGVDNRAGTLDVNPDAARSVVTAAHEIGHTFQYIVSCDYGLTHGWRYGFGANATGGCAWWESCAQWQAFKVYPEQQFTTTWTAPWRYAHLNLLHEEWRYYNFFVQDYWCQLHGPDFIGRLWIESTRPEDPVEAYQRINGETQADFCRDMYNYACRAITWDIDALRERGCRYTDRFETALHHAGDGWWEVDSANCPQNYGFNVIRLRVPQAGTAVKAAFRGEAGAEGYRNYQADKAGWRYGFVALTAAGERVYGDMFSADEGMAQFTVPDNATNLWFVVSGAPREHFRHPWDMGTNSAGNDQHTDASLANDEQWPYRVRFNGTNLPGEYYYPSDYERRDIELEAEVVLDKTHATTTNINAQVDVNWELVYDAIGLGTDVLGSLRPGSETLKLRLRALNADGTESNNLLISSIYYWGFDANGYAIAGSVASTDYVLTQTFSSGKLSVSGVRARLTVGQTYHAGIVLVLTDDGGREYTARVKVKVNVI